MQRKPGLLQKTRILNLLIRTRSNARVGKTIQSLFEEASCFLEAPSKLLVKSYPALVRRSPHPLLQRECWREQGIRNSLTSCNGSGVLGFALKGLADAAQSAKYNKDLAKAMGQKATWVQTAIKDLGESLHKAGQNEEQRKDCKKLLRTLISAIHQCHVECDRLCQQSFMKAMWSTKSNTRRIETLLKAVDQRVAALNTKVAGVHLAVSLEMNEKLDQFHFLLEKMAAQGIGKSDPAEVDTQILADIAKQAGMQANEALKQELSSMSARMEAKQDQILDVVSAMDAQLRSMDRKQDLHHQESMSSMGSLHEKQVDVILCANVGVA